MSIYDPRFAGIPSGWYRKTADRNYSVDRDMLDTMWSPECDELLSAYLERYGTYFVLFTHKRLPADVSRLLQDQRPKDVRYFDYYVRNRVLEVGRLRRLWYSSYEEERQKHFTCGFCHKDTAKFDCDPYELDGKNTTPTFCQNCGPIFRRYIGMDRSIPKAIAELIRSLPVERSCDICATDFSLEYATTFGVGQVCLDPLYSNIFTNICPECLRKAWDDNPEGDSRTHLERLHELYLLVGKVPTQNFNDLIYLFTDRDSIIEFVRHLQRTRSPRGLAQEFGSFLAALIRSGILPEGSRKLAIGTMVLADDGHVCLSIPEKEIDDYLHSLGIEHKKEVRYPNSSFRCDWEIITLGSERVFVEYFGLISHDAYREKTDRKIALAQESGIRLIGIYPTDDWKGRLDSELRKLGFLSEM